MEKQEKKIESRRGFERNCLYVDLSEGDFNWTHNDVYREYEERFWAVR